MRLFPSRTPEERRSERRDALWVFGFFVIVSLSGFALFFLGEELPPSGDSIYSIARWIGLIVGGASLYLALQSLFEALVVATIGYERGLALIVVVGAVCAFLAWLV